MEAALWVYLTLSEQHQMEEAHSSTLMRMTLAHRLFVSQKSNFIQLIVYYLFRNRSLSYLITVVITARRELFHFRSEK